MPAIASWPHTTAKRLCADFAVNGTDAGLLIWPCPAWTVPKFAGRCEQSRTCRSSSSPANATARYPPSCSILGLMTSFARAHRPTSSWPASGQSSVAAAPALPRAFSRKQPISGWHLDARRHEIHWQGQLVPATAIEFRLLSVLVEHLGELVPHTNLLAAGWPTENDPDPLWLKPHLARLRDKLRNIGAPTPTAVRAVGYRLED